jgi:Patatin-like phospholipase
MPAACKVVQSFVLALGVALVAIVPGCASSRRVTTPPAEMTKLRWNTESAVDACRPETDKVLVDGLSAQLGGVPAPPVARPLQVLALSAGGKYAAYSAGLLCGWTETGTRPTFDIVTGVSSGAILSLFAFLGPQYDAKLKCFFTEYNQSDLFPIRPLRNLIVNGSMAAPIGLKRTIDREINNFTLAEIAQAHKAGRRLYLATMNVHTKKLVIWDIGGIACSGRSDSLALVRKVMLAATAVPALLPPVEFDVVVDGHRYTELHCDAGPVTQTFLRFGPHDCPRPGVKWLAGSQLYCLAAGKIDPDPIAGRVGFIDRVSASVSASLYALYRVELMKLYALCLSTGMQFNLVAIPPETVLDVDSTSIQANVMKPLFELGHRTAQSGIPWRPTPPGALEGEETEPRSGTTFHTTK